MEKKTGGNEKIIFYLSCAVGIVSFSLIFIPPFFKEGGLIGAGIWLAISVLSFWFAYMTRKG